MAATSASTHPPFLPDTPSSPFTLTPPPVMSLPFTDIYSDGCVCCSSPPSFVSCDLCFPFGSKARRKMWYGGVGKVKGKGCGCGVGIPQREIKGEKGVKYLSFQRMPDMCLHFLPTFTINSFLTLRVALSHVNLHDSVFMCVCVHLLFLAWFWLVVLKISLLCSWLYINEHSLWKNDITFFKNLLISANYVRIFICFHTVMACFKNHFCIKYHLSLLRPSSGKSIETWGWLVYPFFQNHFSCVMFISLRDDNDSDAVWIML